HPARAAAAQGQADRRARGVGGCAGQGRGVFSLRGGRMGGKGGGQQEGEGAMPPPARGRGPAVSHGAQKPRTLKPASMLQSPGRSPPASTVGLTYTCARPPNIFPTAVPKVTARLGNCLSFSQSKVSAGSMVTNRFGLASFGT